MLLVHTLTQISMLKIPNTAHWSLYTREISESRARGNVKIVMCK